MFIFLLLPAAGSDPYSITAGAGEAGMNYSCIMKPGFWSSFHNQALMSQENSLSFGVSYGNRFNIPELGTRTAGVIIPAGKTTIGALFSNSGYRDFMRHSFGIACGMVLSEKISAGVQIDYFAEKSAGDYGRYQSITFEAGALISASENIRIGLHIFNPVPGSLQKSYLPSTIRAGAGINLSEFLFASAEVRISTGKNPSVKTGFEYEAAKSFLIRGGFSSENTSFSFGMGYTLKFVKVDLGFVTHERLGITSMASLVFEIQ